MIKELEVEIKGHRTNLYHFKKLGYDIKIKKPILVKIKDLMFGSTCKITSICDNCLSEKQIEFRFYYEYTKSLSEKYYCNKCNNIKRKETLISKFGVDNVMKLDLVKSKLKETIIDRYGVSHYSKTKEFKKKYKESCLNKFGVDNSFKSEEVKNKIKSSNLINLGVEYPQQSIFIRNKSKETSLNNWGVEKYSQTKECKQKIKETSIERWGVENYSKTNEFKEKVKETSLIKWEVEHHSKTDNFKNKLKKSREIVTKLRYENLIGDDYLISEYNNSNFLIYHKTCQREFSINRDLLYQRRNLNICICTKCLDVNLGMSNMELEMQDFLNSLNVTYIIKDKSILGGKELDIYLPYYKIAIEMNGVYWHSEIYMDKYYHRDKTLNCRKLGIELIHIWEDDWKFKRDIVKSIILNRLKMINKSIFARNCKIKEVSVEESSSFLNLNHIQGNSPSQLKIGLYLGEELVSLMTFGWRYTNRKKEYELIRFCNKININVVGSASKIFNYFLKMNSVDTIVSYSDISLFTGGIYQKLGFIKSRLSEPNYYWVVDGIRKHRFNYNKKRLVKMGYDPNKSESEILHEIGYFRIYSCGQEKWIFNS